MRPWRNEGFSTAGVAYASAAPAFLALVPVLIRAGLDGGADEVALITVRTAAAALVAWVLIAFTTGVHGLRTSWYRDPAILLAGFAGFVVNPFASYFAIGRIDVAAFVSIYYLHVPLLALATPLLGLERPSRRALGSAIVCSLGVFLAVGGTSPSGSFGDGLGIALSIVAMAGTFVFALAVQRAGRSLNAMHLNAQLMTSSAVLFAIGLGFGAGWRAIDRQTLLFGCAIAAIAWLPGRLLWTYAVQEIGARSAGIFGSIQPGIAAMLGLVVLDQRIGLEQWVGIVLLCLGVAALYFRPPRPPIPEGPAGVAGPAG